MASIRGVAHGQPRQSHANGSIRFAAPPVVEVALAVAFRPVPGLDTVRLARLWDRFRDRFPNVEQQPPIRMATESPEAFAPQSVTFEMAEGPVAPRLWFLSEPGTDLIQVQVDWFARNWRKLETDEGYPSYRRMREEFADHYRELEGYFDDEGLGRIQPLQCELTYINHIFPTGQGSTIRPEEVLTVLAPVPRELKGSLESITLVAQAKIAHDDNFAGRLHVTAVPAKRKLDNREIVALTLTARGRPLGDGLDGVMSFLDLGHDDALRTFVALTKPKMHAIWGRS